MAEAVRKLEPVAQAPDGSKPLKMRWWKCTGTMIGVRPESLIMIGGTWSDGTGTTGAVESITLYPGGNVVVEIIPNTDWDPHGGQPKPSDRRYGVVFGGHGMVEGDWQ